MNKNMKTIVFDGKEFYCILNSEPRLQNNYICCKFSLIIFFARGISGRLIRFYAK